MSRIQQEPQQHIHDRLCTQVNEMVIRLKIWNAETLDEASDEQALKIQEARQRHPYATTKEIIELLEQCRDEMNQCTQPFKLHR
jgi:hypothetical protein